LQAVKVPNSFSIVTNQRGYLVQTANDRDLHDWLYAINPLLAGQIKSKTARARPAPNQQQPNIAQANGHAPSVKEE
jgi:kinesin family protein 1